MLSCFPGSDNKLRRQTSKVDDDGRFNVAINEKVQAKFLPKLLRKQKQATKDQEHDRHNAERKHATFHLRNRKYDFEPDLKGYEGKPRMNIAILIVGSRGDVQPFIALGNVLQKSPYNHRVRICTHPNFKDFVTEHGLEFFSIGGDPEQLMSYMVRNPGVLPSMESMKAGDVGARRAEIAQMLTGCWRACTEAGNGVDPIVLPKLGQINTEALMRLPKPFVVDAIISNPPAYANIHIAEKLAIPLHMMFTMPWSPTTAFSHPLANLKSDKGDRKMANWLSFYSMELLTSEGLIDLINDFRENTLSLDPLHAAWAHTLLPQLAVPFNYAWSPALVPKPADWGPHITISGFFFLKSETNFKPPEDLKEFLAAGPPPVYIGFGSIVVDDPDKMTQMILDAIRQLGSGVRALVSKGWGNIGGADVPDNVFLLGNVPHDWLFPQCKAVVHHGGAGTTAIGISLGLPTVIVPFFGDQPWWGDMVARAGAGPTPIPYKQLNSDKLANQIKQALEPNIQERAKELAARIKNETGSETAAKYFHDTPQMQNQNCFLCPEEVAAWRVRRTNIQLSPLAVAILIDNGKLDARHVKLIRKKRWYVEKGAQDPFVGILGTLGTTGVGYKTCFTELGKDLSADKRGHPGVVVEEEYFAENPGPVKAVGKFAGRLGMNTVRAPINLLYNITNGFHNAPFYLFDDNTVRVRGAITGVKSGLKVGAQELVYGFYDAVTGVVTQPVRGFRHNSDRGIGPGAWGATKGVGKGFGGLVCKGSAAALGVPSYGLKGLERSIRLGWASRDVPDEDNMAMLEYMKQPDMQLKGEARKQVRTAAVAMLLEARGNSVGKQIRGRRGWQAFIELQQLRHNPEKASVSEQEVLESWDRLKVPSEFVQRND